MSWLASASPATGRTRRPARPACASTTCARPSSAGAAAPPWFPASPPRACCSSGSPTRWTRCPRARRGTRPRPRRSRSCGAGSPRARPRPSTGPSWHPPGRSCRRRRPTPGCASPWTPSCSSGSGRQASSRRRPLRERSSPAAAPWTCGASPRARRSWTRSSRTVSRGRRSAGWTGSWRTRPTASAGPPCGSTSRATPTPRGTAPTPCAPSGPTATGSSTRSTGTCPTTASPSSSWRGTSCRMPTTRRAWPRRSTATR